MTQEAGTPRDFWERIQKMIEDAVAKLARSGMLRNASISGGGLTVKGGFLRLLTDDSVELFYVGPYGPIAGDGTVQQGWRVRRADGTSVLAMYDAVPGFDGTFNQALNWLDREGHVVFADDTNSGQGVARPYVGGNFGRARYSDMTVQTTSGTFETLWRTGIRKQQPRLEVSYLASTDGAGVTGEVRVLVDGVQLGTTTTEGFALTTRYAGPAAISGAHMEYRLVEIQGRVTSGAGSLRVEPSYWVGMQS